MKTANVRTAILAAALLGLFACQSGPPEKPGSADGTAAAVFNPQPYEDLARDQGEVFWVDGGNSVIRLYLWRGGPLAEKGHNHVMVVRQMEGAVFLPADILAGSVKLDVVFRAADIEVDPPALRRRIGGAFAAEIPPQGIRDTRDHMLGANVLNADRYPRVGLHALKAHGELPKLAIEAEVTLHGASHRLLIPLTVVREEDRLTAAGAFVIRQTTFGIEPFATMGGSLFVQDPIMVEFYLRAKAR